MEWKQSEIDFLILNYPQKGRGYCAKALNRPVASIRQKTWRLKLKQDRSSPFFIDWQKRAAYSKIGKKRPDQAAVLRKIHQDGKLKKTEQQKKAISNRIKKWHAENDHPRGMLGVKHSNESRKLMSIGQRKWLDNLTSDEREERNMARTRKILLTRWTNNKLSPERKKVTWRGAWREIGGIKKYYRSTWEANYARYLEWLKKLGQIQKWEHEPEIFWFKGIKRGTVSYLPDFRITNQDGSIEFHEVKGWMDSASLTKIKRMAIYHPTVKLIIIAAKEYKEIEKKAAAMLQGWEYAKK